VGDFSHPVEQAAFPKFKPPKPKIQQSIEEHPPWYEAATSPAKRGYRIISEARGRGR